MRKRRFVFIGFYMIHSGNYIILIIALLLFILLTIGRCESLWHQRQRKTIFDSENWGLHATSRTTPALRTQSLVIRDPADIMREFNEKYPHLKLKSVSNLVTRADKLAHSLNPRFRSSRNRAFHGYFRARAPQTPLTQTTRNTIPRTTAPDSLLRSPYMDLLLDQSYAEVRVAQNFETLRRLVVQLKNRSVQASKS